MLEAVGKLCADESWPAWQVLFPDETSAREAEATGLALRVSFQFHWRNEGYRSVDDFLARFNAKRRHMLRREMAAAEEQGITIRTVRNPEPSWAKAAHALHRSTVDKLMWGRRWLNEKFYQLIFAKMPDALEVVAAERDGKLVAGAFNVASPTHLYGRYWGCFEEHPFLHFNVCYYHSIAQCIARARFSAAMRRLCGACHAVSAACALIVNSAAAATTSHSVASVASGASRIPSMRGSRAFQYVNMLTRLVPPAPKIDI